MPLNPDVEKDLIVFLREQREADCVNTQRRIFEWMQEHDVKDTDRHGEIIGTLRGHSLRIGAVEKITDKLIGSAEDTGRHHVADLQSQLERAREEKSWLLRNWFPIVTGFVLVVFELLKFLRGH